MGNVRTSRVTAALTVVLVTGVLAYLQSRNAEKDLLALLCASAIIALASLLALGFTRLASPPDLLCVAATATFCSYLVIRGIFSPVAYVARADIYNVLTCLILYGLTVTAFFRSSRRISVIAGLLAFAVVHVFVTVVQFGFAKNFDLLLPSLANVENGPRGSGLYIDPDHLAGLLEVLGVLGLSITVWSRWPHWSRVIVGYLTAICYLGLALTGSRGGYWSAITSLFVFCGLSFATLRSAGEKRFLKFGAIGIFFLIATVVAVLALFQKNDELRARSMTQVDRGRLDRWQAAIEQWKLRPLVGTGSGTYLYYGREFRAPSMQDDAVEVHNDYLHLLCEYGLTGALAFIFFFSVHLRRGWQTFMRLGPRRLSAGSSLRSDRLALNIGALCAISAYVVHSTVDFNLHIPANALVLAFVFGLIANPALETSVSRRFNITARVCVIILALALLFEAVRLIPGELYTEKSRVALRDEDPTTARKFAEKALSYGKQNPNTFFYLGRSLVSLGDQSDQIAERPALYDCALRTFDQARHLVPLDGTFPLEMARVYDRVGRFDEAEKMFVLARQRDPRSETVEQLYQSHLKREKESASVN